MWTRRHLILFLALATVTASTTAVVFVANLPPGTGLIPFQTYGQLNGYISGARSAGASSPFGSGLIAGPARSPIAAPNMGLPAAPGRAYSGTNVQVAGVDELDPVKTDGTYLYVGSQARVTVFLAYPASNLHILSRIDLRNLTSPVTGSNATSVVGLFLDGTTLVVVANAFSPMPWVDMYRGTPVLMGPVAVPAAATMRVAPQDTFAFLFDVTDPAQPVLEHTLVITGSASTGRMVGSTVYLVATEWIRDINGTVLPPQLCADGACRALAPDEIYRDPQSADAWDYTNLLAIDLGTGDARPMSIVTGGTSVLYMSPTALYLAFYKWMLATGGASPLVMPIRTGAGWTTIYKLEASGLELRTVGSADVDGTLLNQYSMDEWNGTLRVATTVRDFGGNASSVYSNVYAFDASMHGLGSVTHLAPGESIFAVRFLGDRAYVVTFRKIDPLFVIDLANASAPKVTGFLEMPGFSQYLYPLDAGHLIGVGKDALPAEGNWSWYQGLKLSLYDVTNGSHPAETSNVSIGDRGTDSEVLWDPHAFLYIPERGLVVLPVDLAIIDPSQYPEGVPPYAWGNVVWQGDYVYRVNATTGFTYVGRIAMGNGTVMPGCGWYGAPTEIRRSLYIGDTLYTVSATQVAAYSLVDLSPIASVTYTDASSSGYGCPVLIE